MASSSASLRIAFGHDGTGCVNTLETRVGVFLERGGYSGLIGLHGLLDPGRP